ncbi:unnamed protein product [Mycetohabitans rhizoxinica HKI 454]|uniref:Uncharacterized protein n=1 Tax=Mycetohabitans rhizoxinica (strain DSM 19002 / CIP 109453 / HKI 454) TaxID=882378 RepID=E5AL56_MYCRK|nr:unnamed protein product [Mycetohabitans rhizoxinica HKI 454]
MRAWHGLPLCLTNIQPAEKEDDMERSDRIARLVRRTCKWADEGS